MGPLETCRCFDTSTGVTIKQPGVTKSKIHVRVGNIIWRIHTCISTYLRVSFSFNHHSFKLIRIQNIPSSHNLKSLQSLHLFYSSQHGCLLLVSTSSTVYNVNGSVFAFLFILLSASAGYSTSHQELSIHTDTSPTLGKGPQV
jgi:hypothetical protein